MASFRDLLARTKAEIREVDTATADEQIGRPDTIVLDVREPDEYDQGALPGAIHISKGIIERDIEHRIPDKNAAIVLYCGGGADAGQGAGAAARGGRVAARGVAQRTRLRR